MKGPPFIFLENMDKFILGKKVKMSQIWQDEKVIPVTVVKAEPNTVSDLRNLDKHGYEAVQVSMPIGKRKILREFRSESKEIKKGDVLDVSLFNEGDKVVISSISRGKGFQSAIKRHGFHGGPKSHGQKDRHRAPGSLGAGGVQKVRKGLRMAGHDGLKKVSVKNLTVVKVNKEDNTLFIMGAVPGFNGSVLEIKK